MPEVLSVKVKWDDVIYDLPIKEDDIYQEYDEAGSIRITIDWEDQLLRLIKKINQPPPEYNNEE